MKQTLTLLHAAGVGKVLQPPRPSPALPESRHLVRKQNSMLCTFHRFERRHTAHLILKPHLAKKRPAYQTFSPVTAIN